MMNTWLIASNNEGKSRDLIACLDYYGLTARQYLSRYPRLTFPTETTTSYSDNAVAKARFGAQQLGVPVIADDSGLEIPALPDLLGVTTARDLGVAVGGSDRNQAILAALRDVPSAHRRAVMRATLAAAWPDGRIVVVQAAVAGYIAQFQIGRYSGGFDRIFWLSRYGKTLAELPTTWRIPLTHRGQAALKLITKL
ncbi:non-canonical purine NTP pyrophosphatase [Lactiplantibacillus paraplantarum]|uniref:non-canonical purine NTP pyrophosphatase n=1 Tax=Lactiplantibacillus paraplantarum TaxID=60520 RepID=UPI0023AB357C|nr:non-canonical purine NTP pyrophosphatase [Lactiplantibacillus paraplantarum]WEE35748.1 non-canonical purine NTP pyrophosphatase [Lactiplantibacillus paraplantarum]